MFVSKSRALFCAAVAIQAMLTLAQDAEEPDPRPSPNAFIHPPDVNALNLENDHNFGGVVFPSCL
jgi:hypothetical protein